MTKKTTTTSIIASAYFVTLLAVLVYAIYTVRAEGVAFVALQTTLAEQNAKQDAARTINQLVASTEADRAKLATYLVTENDTIALITEIENLAVAIGVSLKREDLAIVPATATDAPALKTKFSVNGQETSVQRFMEAVELLPYHTTIPSMTLGRDGTRWQGSVEVLVTLSV